MYDVITSVPSSTVSSSKMKLYLVSCLLVYLVLVDETRADEEPAGPFKVKVLNDLVKAMLTIHKIALDILSRNLEDRDGLKYYVKQVYGPFLKFLKEILNEVE